MALCARILAVTALAVVMPEPAAAEAYRVGDYRAPTPLTLDGAVTVDTDEARALMDSGAVTPIDVMPVPRRPASGEWLQPKLRHHLPGSVWLPNAGVGDPTPAQQAWFHERLHQVTGGSRTAGLMFYCVIDCWMSWNAAKRAVSWGYRRVYWYPDGSDGWGFAGLDLVPAILPPASEVPR